MRSPAEFEALRRRVMSGERVSLYEIAPRLAIARDAHLARQEKLKELRAHIRKQVLKAEWLVAHRDLQLVRAYATGDSRYMRRREKKLKAAKLQLAYWQRLEAANPLPQLARAA